VTHAKGLGTRSVPKGVAHERAKVGALSRSRTPDDPELIEARTNLAVEGLAEHVKRVVSEAPQLSTAQLDKLCALLRGAA